MNKLLLITLTIVLTSCAYMQSVSQTSIPRNKSKVVSAKVEKNIIFLFNFDNDYVDDLTQQLIKQCPNGSVKGILTKDEIKTYFPVVFSKSIITAEGYCVGSKSRKSKRKSRR